MRVRQGNGARAGRSGSVKLGLALLFLLGGVGALWRGSSATGQGQAQGEAAVSAEDAAFFEKRVRPVLMTHCAKCHNPTAQVAALDLTTAEGVAQGGESGPLIDRERPEQSRLLRVVGYQESLKMPPSGKLPPEDLEALAEWVRRGAPWPATGGQRPVAARSTRPGSVLTEKDHQYWAFQPMADPKVPLVKRRDWVRNPIDAFLLAELEAKGVEPARPADKLTLLRRATFDLTGLPPTEAESRAFLADTSPDAFARVVDRLLASPRYGEKWGRHWLDVARYADSTGNDEDHRYPHAWRYRDYVIEAFNRDLPYDQFVREQLAGDLLPAPDGAEVNRRGRVATGFLALGPKALAQQDKKRMLYDVYDEQVEVTSKAFLGLTLACARCHNHKFDPLLTRDYYAMVGMFASTRSFEDPNAFVSPPLTTPLVPRDAFARYQTALATYKEGEKRLKLALELIVDGQKEARIERLQHRLADYFLAARQVYHGGAAVDRVAREQGLEEKVLAKWVSYLKPGDDPRQHLLAWHQAEDPAAEAAAYQRAFQVRLAQWRPRLAAWQSQYQAALAAGKPLPDRPAFVSGEDRFFAEVYLGKKGAFSVDDAEESLFTPAEWGEVTRLKAALEAHRQTLPAEPEMACAVAEGERVTQRVLIRGDIHNEGEVAPRAVPTVLADKTASAAFEARIASVSGRLELANWMTHPEHPLTARVMANRLWLWHFGEGIVRTPDNFGRMGEPPTHPALLDWLARAMVRSGWSIKSMHRLLMLSSAYQMSSEVTPAQLEADPENRLFSRFSRRRLTIEEMRDSLLVIDRTIDWTMGGTLQSGTGTDSENDSKRLSLNPEAILRRSVYLPLRRANLPTLLNLFDFGDATAMSGKRQLTNIATQALFWMNSGFVTERTANLGRLLLESPTLPDDEARVRAAYWQILNRPPSSEEASQALDYLRRFPAGQGMAAGRLASWQSLCRILLASNEFLYLD